MASGARVVATAASRSNGAVGVGAEQVDGSLLLADILSTTPQASSYTKLENSPISSAHNTDVDHGMILPIPAENAELNFSSSHQFHATLG